MLNAGFVVADAHLYGRVSAIRVAGNTGRSAAGGLFCAGTNLPINQALRADFSLDTDSSFEDVASTASLKYQIPTVAEKRR